MKKAAGKRHSQSREKPVYYRLSRLCGMAAEAAAAIADKAVDRRFCVQYNGIK